MSAGVTIGIVQRVVWAARNLDERCAVTASDRAGARQPLPPPARPAARAPARAIASSDGVAGQHRLRARAQLRRAWERGPDARATSHRPVVLGECACRRGGPPRCAASPRCDPRPDASFPRGDHRHCAASRPGGLRRVCRMSANCCCALACARRASATSCSMLNDAGELTRHLLEHRPTQRTLVAHHFRRRGAEVPHQAGPRHRLEHVEREVDLVPAEALARGALVGVMVVVPPLAERDERQPPVVARVVAGDVALRCRARAPAS